MTNHSPDSLSRDCSLKESDLYTQRAVPSEGPPEVPPEVSPEVSPEVPPEVSPEALRETRRKTPAELLQILAERDLTYTLHHHPPLHTVEDALELRGDLEGCYIKNLYLQDRSKQMALIVCLNTRSVDLQQLRRALGYRRLSFASPDRLWRDLGVRPGSVSPLALCNAELGALRVFADLALKSHPITNMHPLTNEMTAQLAWRDWEQLCAEWGFTVEWIDFEELTGSSH